MMFSNRIIVCVIFATLAHCKCYYPNRAEAVIDVPCVEGAEASACCAPDATCLKNGACFSGGVISRGACTDIDWRDSACFPACKQRNTNGGLAVVPCYGIPGVDWTFACGVGKCNDTSSTFTLKHAEMDAFGLVLRPPQLSSAISTASTSTATQIFGPNGTVCAAIGDVKGFTTREMAGVGIGIGLPLTAIVCVLSWLLVRAQRKSRDLKYNMGRDVETIDKAALDYSEYTIGWITVKPESELVAARLMLDEAHTKIGVRGDPNIYYPGRVGKHNVIICCSGEAGQHQAAECAINMIRTFTNIKLGLLSGIGGGVPSPKHDIRLGDVVVGMPDGVYGGVAVYNSGKMTHEGYELRSHLNCSPRVIRNTVGDLQAEIEMGRDGILENLDRVAFPQYKSCETLVDQLFEDDEPQEREERPTPGPVVHHGLIACGDWVIKDGIGRDELVKRVQGDVLCFEMEAAGLMNAFPCLVVRGISDYCDKHKNDGWHRYASATAAAYCKWVLQELSPNAVGDAETAASLTDVH